MSAFAQDVVWKTGVYSFFDNAEYGFSKWKQPQTMAGVHLSPEIGLSWKENHRVFAGFDAMHEFGSDQSIDYFDPIVYYELSTQFFRFYMGAIPRKLVLDKYPRMFFQDSILNYRPVMNGFFWEYASGNNYFNAWLDWVTRQTEMRREQFFSGWSGKINLGVFYGQHFGYLTHFAMTKNDRVRDGVHDNILLLTSLGIDLSSKSFFDELNANAGFVIGFERDRSLEVWNHPKGFLSEVRIEYKGLGLLNTYYNGQGQQLFYNDHQGDLYWGDSFYRSSNYDRADLYLYFFKSDVVNLKMTWSLHFSEQKIYHQQLLTASVDLNNLKKKESKKYHYLWDNLFNNHTNK